MLRVAVDSCVFINIGNRERDILANRYLQLCVHNCVVRTHTGVSVTIHEIIRISKIC